jgi:hypothetical protein
MGTSEQHGGYEPEVVSSIPDEPFFEHMVLLAAQDRFDLRTSVYCREAAADHLVDLGYAGDIDEALQIVVDRETQMREELYRGSA